jgi:DNA-directed RNA polymerase specialized sigma24 family protein
MTCLMASEADQHLADLLKTKNREAFAQLYDRYAGALYGFICRTTPDTVQAEVLLEQVFVNAWKEIDSYNPSRERLFIWMFRLTLKLCGQTTEHIKAIHL